MTSLLFLLATVATIAQDSKYIRTEDVIYGRKLGMCLTLDVFKPTGKTNGRGIIFCVSSGWYSDKRDIQPELLAVLLDRGHTVFAVLHSSQPKFAITEVLVDMHRAVRFIRHKAKDYQIDPDKLGILGHSAGGHLALMQGVAPEEGDKSAVDPVDRESSRVAVVAALAAPCDFLNWGKPGTVNLGDPTKPGVIAAFEFPKLVRETLTYAVERDPKKREEIGRSISPAARVTAATPPIFLLHGDADTNVPVQQSEWIAAKLTAAKVPHEFVIKKGGGHNWKEMGKDMTLVADWFEKHTK